MIKIALYHLYNNRSFYVTCPLAKPFQKSKKLTMGPLMILKISFWSFHGGSKDASAYTTIPLVMKVTFVCALSHEIVWLKFMFVMA